MESGGCIRRAKPKKLRARYKTFICIYVNACFFYTIINYGKKDRDGCHILVYKV